MPHSHVDYTRIVEQTVFLKVRSLLEDKFGIASHHVELDSALVGDLGIEQADIEYLALSLEAAFDIDITVDDAARMVRVRDAVRCILVPRVALSDAPPNS